MTAQSKKQESNVITLNETSAMRDKRRAHNLNLALKLAKAGIYIFPTVNKMPAIAMWQRSNKSILATEKKEYNAERKANGKRHAKFFGATTNAKLIREMWRAYPDATPSISLGPSGLYVIDADHKPDAGKFGPDNLREYNAIHDFLEGSLCVQSQSVSAHYYFRDIIGTRKGTLGNDIDLLGIGAQVVAPGAWRADGKRYEDKSDELIAAIRNDTLPDVPAYISGHVTATKAKETKATAEIDPDTLDARCAEIKRMLDYLTEWESDDPDLRTEPDKPDAYSEHDTNEQWLAVAQAIHHATNGSEQGYALLDEWSARDDATHDLKGDNRARWDSFKAGPGKKITINTLRKFAMDRGYMSSDGSELYAVVDDDEAENVARDDSDEFGDKVQPRLNLLAAYNQTKAAMKNPLIDGILQKHRVLSIVADSNVGKSLLLAQFGQAIMTGGSFLDFKAAKAGFVYLALEDFEGAIDKVTAACLRAGATREQIAAMPFDVVTEADFTKKENSTFDFATNYKAILRILQTKAERLMRECGVDHVVIMIDTFSDIHFGDDSKSADMQKVMRNIEKLKRYFTVIFSHHTGKDGSLERGSTVIKAKSDVMLLLTESKSEVKMTFRKNRQGAKSTVRTLHIVEQAIDGLDDDAARKAPVIILKKVESDGSEFDDTSATEGNSTSRGEAVRLTPKQKRAAIYNVIMKSPLIAKGDLVKAAGLAKSTGYDFLATMESQKFVSFAKGKWTFERKAQREQAALAKDAEQPDHTLPDDEF